MNDPRFHRDDPERTEPYRDFSNVFQSSDGTWTDAPGWMDAQAAPAPPPLDPVSQTIRQCYGMMGQQMALGQQIAQSMAPALFAPVPRQAVEQMLRAWANAYVDTMMVWFDLFSPVRQPIVKQPLTGSLPFTVNVRSTRKTRWQAQVQPNAGGPLQVLPFWAKDRTLPPLMDVGFIASGSVLQIQVPDIQPPAVYFGVLSNPAGLAVGSIALEILQT